jgi:serine/threonine protein kinase
MSTPLEAAARQRVGQVLRGKWRIDGLLGVGGMASVFAGTHRNGNRVAIKILHPQVAVDPSIQERFLREGYVANAVGHDGAVSVLDDDTTEDGAVFLVMELLEGETLDARAERLGGRLPVSEVVSLADQLLEVLASAHAKGIVHRDIKPENLFLTKKGQLKVLDFGIARLLDGAGASSATKTGSMLGTPAFMAPEQALGHVKEIDQRTDIWAVGATMFALLAGRPVHPGSTVNEQLIAAATRPVAPVMTLVPGLPVVIARVMDRALAYDKANRWSSARDMLDALRDGDEVTVMAAPSAVAMALASTGTVVAAPRAEFVSSPDIAAARPNLASSPSLTSRSPSGSGTAAMAAPPVITASGMAVGRTLAEQPAKPQRVFSPILLAAGIGGGALLGLAVLVAVVLLASDHGDGDPAPNVSSATVASATASSEKTPTRIEPEPPRTEERIDPDSLPAAGPATLEIVAQGGQCKVIVDGETKGTTPIKALAVPAGDHEVHCVSTSGTSVRKVKAESGATQTVAFAVKPAPAPAATPASGCRTSSECRHNRVCVRGQCVSQPAPKANPLDVR